MSQSSLSINRPKSDGDRVRRVESMTRESCREGQSYNDGIAQDKEELDEDWIVVKKSTSNDEVSNDLKNGSNVAMISSNMTDTMADDISDVPSKPENDSVNKKEDENEKLNVATNRHDLLSSSFSNVLTIATTISKWKRRRATEKANLSFRLLDDEHQLLLKNENDNMKIEIPDAILWTIKNESYKIIRETTQAYRSQIGSKHKLTLEAEDYMKNLAEDLGKIKLHDK
ncbi:uncharacterized protein LOC124441220 [Xenia sp. Carnegie-2017]|uniref:uncharacterized protein LOC124441220 n=1 Tax=Xenia sp. Carnegie-2017 TaxID=2897299 RepID=UPI001F041491|nr:uncharacterized protein LOC124441220 [Xenia sp. Carnegie-2017]